MMNLELLSRKDQLGDCRMYETNTQVLNAPTLTNPWLDQGMLGIRLSLRSSMSLTPRNGRLSLFRLGCHLNPLLFVTGIVGCICLGNGTLISGTQVTRGCTPQAWLVMDSILTGLGLMGTGTGTGTSSTALHMRHRCSSNSVHKPLWL